MWYTLNNILTYNALFNIVIGERGVGKTYDSKKYVAKKFIKKGEEFVYLRRYNTELKESVGTANKQKFFEQIKGEFPDHELTNTADVFKINDKICGYALSLSTASKLKSTSFEKVTTIIFDEFIIDKGCYRYLPNEVEAFLDIYETISRLRNVRVFFLGNAISISNPYFMYFNLHLPYNKNIITFNDGSIAIEYIKNLAYRDVKKKTRFGNLIKDTNYGKYAIDNEFLRDSKTFIQKKTGVCKLYCNMYMNNIYYGVWIDYNNQLLYISNDYDKSCPINISLNIEDHNENTVMFRGRDSKHFQLLIMYFRQSALRFENMKIKNEFMPKLSRFISY